MGQVYCILGYGFQARLVEAYFTTQAVDTLADLDLVESLMWDDPLVPIYMHKA